MPNTTGLRCGVLSAVAAHVMWGLFPLYWKQLENIPSEQLVFHRVLWSFVVLTLLMVGMRLGARVDAPSPPAVGFASMRLWSVHAFAAVLIAINWFAFLWAVNHDAVLQASLGYYINPLFNVLLGVFLLGERLLPIQWIALSLAATGVAVMTVATGGVPWVALAMATSFSVYGLVKKRTPMSPLPGLWLEMAILSPLSLALLVYTASRSLGDRPSGADPYTWLLLLGGGMVTVLPLALFALAARRVPLSLIGVLQYIGPTLQFLVGAIVYREPLDRWRLLGFVLVWCGVILYLHSSARSALARRAQ